jgi:hypothetical protein
MSTQLSETDGIRDGAGSPTTTRVETVRARVMGSFCPHGLPAWKIDDERWHVAALEQGYQLLRPCEAK